MSDNNKTGLEIAVIGMSARFPGSKNIAEYWDNLKNGRETIVFFSTEELLEKGVSQGLINEKNYIKARGVLNESEKFDASFFNYSVREAEIMDPQMRILHECAWEALEDAGYVAESSNKLIGIYSGASTNFYWQAISGLLGRSNDFDQFDFSQLIDRDFLSTRIAHKLNLKGPAVTVQTACSTSLVAIHMACQGLLSGDCDMALAGGVSLSAGIKGGYLFKDGMINSADGHCRAFDQAASGTVSGEGAGIVILKRLDEAIEDGDYIYAMVIGSSINNDGNDKSEFNAPSVEGQATVIRHAHQIADILAESVSYIEAYSIGTTLGDPIEIEALKLAFKTEKKNFCALGSVKTNIGYLAHAAGIAGFIKTVLALKNKFIPPSLHYLMTNEKIDFKNSPFYVNTELKEWLRESSPRRAGVSSFGIGGTNAHVVLEEAPEINPTPESRNRHLILLSAETKDNLGQIRRNLQEYLNLNPQVSMADIAYTLQVGRKTFKHKNMLVCKNRYDLITNLENGRRHTAISDTGKKIIFMFPGPGTQYINMARELYHHELVFRTEMDACFEIIISLMGNDLRKLVYPDLKSESNSAQGVKNIDQTEITQPLLFIIEYALAKLLIKWNIKPYAMIGHSLGEYVAAHLAGVFSLEDALKLVAFRGKFMQRMPRGSMLSVALPENQLLPFLNDELSLAAVNGPCSCVASGTERAVNELKGAMEKSNVVNSILRTSHAFHSQMMDPVLKDFEQKVREVELKEPEIPFISNVSGTWITPSQAKDPGYWVKQMCYPVRFANGINELLSKENPIFVEIGPGRILSTLVRKIYGSNTQIDVVNLIRHKNENVSDTYYLLEKIGLLWLKGCSIDWHSFYQNEPRKRIPLPTYPFNRENYPLILEKGKSVYELLSRKSGQQSIKNIIG